MMPYPDHLFCVSILPELLSSKLEGLHPFTLQVQASVTTVTFPLRERTCDGLAQQTLKAQLLAATRTALPFVTPDPCP